MKDPDEGLRFEVYGLGFWGGLGSWPRAGFCMGSLSSDRQTLTLTRFSPKSSGPKIGL